MKPLPLLYTFRRCPYAIRARMAIMASGVAVEMHEVDLRNKPAAMLACSPKGTVPVLQLADGSVLEESLDIMRWALGIDDPFGWLRRDAATMADMSALMAKNDTTFKYFLDRYKYAGRYPEHSVAHYRGEGEKFLAELTARLDRRPWLGGESVGWADIAIFPFVRQFAQIDREWFYAAHAGPLARWLDAHIESTLFQAVMAVEKKPDRVGQPAQ